MTKSEMIERLNELEQELYEQERQLASGCQLELSVLSDRPEPRHKSEIRLTEIFA